MQQHKLYLKRLYSTANIEVLRTGYFPDISVWPAAMFEGSNVQWRLRKSAFRIAVQLRRQLYSNCLLIISVQTHAFKFANLV